MSYEHLPDHPQHFWEQMLSKQGYPVDYDPDWDIVEAVQQCVERLDDTDKTLIQLLVYDKCSYNEITEIMGYSSKSVAWYSVRKSLEALKVLILEHPLLAETLGENCD